MTAKPRKLFSPYASCMFQDVPSEWKPFLLGDNKPMLIQTLQRISKLMMKKYGVGSVYDSVIALGKTPDIALGKSGDQYLYPHPANLFAAFFRNTPDKIRAIILGDHPRNNTGIAYATDRFGHKQAGSYGRQISAIQQLLNLDNFDPRGTTDVVLWLNYSLTANPRIVSNAQTVRDESTPVAYALDPNPGWVAHDWSLYINQVVASLLAAYPNIVVVNWVGADIEHKYLLRGCSPTQPQFSACDNFVQLSSILCAQGMPRDPITNSCIMWGRPAYQAVAAYAADGSCKGYRTSGCVTKAAVYTPKMYGGVPNLVDCCWVIDVPAYEVIFHRDEKSFNRGAEKMPGCNYIYITNTPATPTNNRGELLGLLRALDHAVQYYSSRHSEAPMHLILDSTYAMGTAAEWCWNKCSNDFSAVEKNRDMVRAVYLAMNELADAMACCGRNMFCSAQTAKAPSATSVDMGVYFSRCVIYHQMSHLDKKGKVPRPGKNWIENLPWDRWSANNEVDKLMD